ncbi:MAG: sulfotransferase [Planctomycetota bacterium]
MSNGPDFIIIGAMKCATSTLHDQLAAQDGIFMTSPKEPNFFSDDDVFSRGESWYRDLFADAAVESLCGESSTHYSKLPTHDHTIERLVEMLGTDLRLVYMMRHPVDRLVSHYMHEWSQREITCPIDEAVSAHPELVDYGRYAYQLESWMNVFGQDAILPVFFERFVAEPQDELQRIATFLGLTSDVTWVEELKQRNASGERLRRSPVRDLLIDNPLARSVRRTLVPKSWRDRAKAIWTMQDRPTLSPDVQQEVCQRFDEDLATLGRWLNVGALSCETFKKTVREQAPAWVTVAEEIAS